MSSGRDFGADDFLPVLSYFLVQVNQPEVLTEVIYMMELLDPAYLTGEGRKHTHTTTLTVDGRTHTIHHQVTK